MEHVSTSQHQNKREHFVLHRAFLWLMCFYHVARDQFFSVVISMSTSCSVLVALDVLCDKEGAHDSARCSVGHHCPEATLLIRAPFAS